MKYHPLSLLFPKLSEEDFQELAEDIKANGLKHKILIYDNQILDGRHRYEACQRAGLDMADADLYETYRGASPKLEVISRNLHRRHLTDLERTYLATSLSDYPQGSCKSKLQIGNLPTVENDDEYIPFTAEEAAAQFSVTKDQIHKMKPIVKRGSKALQEAVKSGQVPVSKAAAVVDLPKSQQLSAARGNPLFAYVQTEPAHVQVDPLDVLVMKLDEWWKTINYASGDSVVKKVKSLVKEIKSTV